MTVCARLCVWTLLQTRCGMRRSSARRVGSPAGRPCRRVAYPRFCRGSGGGLLAERWSAGGGVTTRNPAPARVLCVLQGCGVARCRLARAAGVLRREGRRESISSLAGCVAGAVGPLNTGHTAVIKVLVNRAGMRQATWLLRGGVSGGHLPVAFWLLPGLWSGRVLGRGVHGWPAYIRAAAGMLVAGSCAGACAGSCAGSCAGACAGPCAGPCRGWLRGFVLHARDDGLGGRNGGGFCGALLLIRVPTPPQVAMPRRQQRGLSKRAVDFDSTPLAGQAGRRGPDTRTRSDPADASLSLSGPPKN